jgi:hypothetical protein
MSEDKKYNGWANYETWLVKLWIDNDEGSYAFWQTEAQITWDNLDTKEDGEFCTEFADALKDHFEENSPAAESGVYADLINAALSEVDWYEIAEHYLEDIDKSSEEETEESSV